MRTCRTPSGGDPIRCAIVQHLSESGDTTVNDLAALFPVSLQAVSKHIKVLQAAGVVTQLRRGRQRPVRLQPDRVVEAANWLDGRLRTLEDRYAQLDELLGDIQTGDH
jgi:DNA-binding transcriptional ArsR family regulator